MRHRNPNRRRRIAAAAAVALAVATGVDGGRHQRFRAERGRRRGRTARHQAHAPVPEGLWACAGTEKASITASARRWWCRRAATCRRRKAKPAVTANPAWPNDPDVQQRKVEATKKKLPNRTAAETMEAEGRPISRSELDRGKIARGTSANAGSPQNPDESARAMRPSELGSKSFFSDIFSSFSDKGETGTFTGEPTRESLTAPPAGYQTPSPAQPYGLLRSKRRARQRRSKTAPREPLAKRRRPAIRRRVFLSALHPFAHGRCRGAFAREVAGWRSLVGHRLAQTPDHLGRACSRCKRACRRCRNCHRRCAADFAFHLGQRARGRGHSRSPRAGRDPHALVQGRLRRRDRRASRGSRISSNT